MPDPDFIYDEEMGIVFDMRPKKKGGLPLIYRDGKWIPFEGCLVGVDQMRQLTIEEAAELTGDKSPVE